MRVDRRDQRCMVVNVDPQTLERDPSILRTIANERQARLARLRHPRRPGHISLGDLVSLAPKP